LVNRLATEAVKSATHVLRLCIRALDYVPPVDITFGEYLRGLITADADLVPDDRLGYRIAFVEAFRKRGLYPNDLNTLSVDTVLWQGVDLSGSMERYEGIVAPLKKFADDCLYIDDRHKLFDRTRAERTSLHGLVKAAWSKDPEIAVPLGVDPTMNFEVHELRRAERTAPDGSTHPQVIVAITQERDMSVPGATQPMKFHGGATVIIDLKTVEIKYAIRKSINHQDREQNTKTFVQRSLRNPLMAMLLDPLRPDRFAILHALADMED
jgi:hypothetical protein